MLLCGHRVDRLPVAIDDSDLADPEYEPRAVVNKRYLYLSALLAKYWQRWQSEYLTSLRETDKNLVKGTNNNIKVGQIVQIRDDQSRLFWKLARVEELVQGADGNIRTAIVKTSTGRTSRPLVHLYPLELHCNLEPKIPDAPPSIPVARNQRLAAIAARDKIKRMSENNN